MTKTLRFLCGLTAALVLVGGLAVFASEDVTLNGKFVWVRDDGTSEGDLKAVFTPTGENRWDVAFHFEWEDGPHVYAGTAEGNLRDGKLRGEVLNDSEERPSTFRFEGAFENGVFSGKHAYLDEGEPKEMGTLTLNAAK